MKLPTAWHLPGLEPGPPGVNIDGTPLRVPDLDATQVQSVSRRLRQAAKPFRSEPRQVRVERVARACEALRAKGPGAWREALARSAGLSSAGFDAAWDVTFAPLDAVRLTAALAAESLDDRALAERDAEVRCRDRFCTFSPATCFRRRCRC